MESGEFHLIYSDGRKALFFDPSASLSDVLRFATLYNQGRTDDRRIVEVISKEGTKALDPQVLA